MVTRLLPRRDRKWPVTVIPLRWRGGGSAGGGVPAPEIKPLGGHPTGRRRQP